MEKTPFAGLTRLAPGDLLSADGWSFQDINPVTIDRLLRIGVQTHKHDAHARLAHSATPIDPIVAVVNTGGTIKSDQTIFVGYTLIDADDGETVLNTNVQTVTTQAGLASSTSAPTLASDHTAGTLLADTYTYGVTVTDGTGGETSLSPTASIVIDPGFPNSRITISGLAAIVTAAGGTGWRLWKMVGAGQWGLIATGTGASIVDNGSLASDCTVQPPASTSHSTVATSKLQVTIPATSQPASAVSFRIYASLDGSFTNPCLLGTYPRSDFGVLKQYTALTLASGAPPDVSTAYPGASKINPDTDMLDFPWKRSVPTALNLPSSGNSVNDVRVVSDSGRPYRWTGATWVPLNAPLDGGLIRANHLKFLTGATPVVDLYPDPWPSIVGAAVAVNYTESWAADDKGTYAFPYGSTSDVAIAGGKLAFLATALFTLPVASVATDGTWTVKIDTPEDGNNTSMFVGNDLSDGIAASLQGAPTNELHMFDFFSGADVLVPYVMTSGVASIWLQITRAPGNQAKARIWETDPGLGGSPTAETALMTIGSPSALAGAPVGLFSTGPVTARYDSLTVVGNYGAAHVTQGVSVDLLLDGGGYRTVLLAREDLGQDMAHVVNAFGGSAPAFTTGWANHAAGLGPVVSFWKDTDGIVHLEGLAVKASPPSAGDVIVTLPTGYRPTEVTPLGTVSGDGTVPRAFGAVDIGTNGDVIWRAGQSAGTTPWISLNGLSFST